MAITLSPPAFRQSYFAIAHQQDRAQALVDAINGPVTVKFYAGATLRKTQVHGALTIVSAIPRRVQVGAYQSQTALAGAGAVTHITIGSASVEYIRMDASAPSLVSLVAPLSANPVDMSAVVIAMDSALPVSAAPPVVPPASNASGLTWSDGAAAGLAEVSFSGFVDGTAHVLEQVSARTLSTGQVERKYRFKAGSVYHESMLVISEGNASYTAFSVENTYLDGAGIASNAAPATRVTRIVDSMISGTFTTAHGSPVHNETMGPANRKIFDLGAAPAPAAIPSWALLGLPKADKWAGYTQPATPDENVYPYRGVWRTGMGNGGISGDIGPITEWSMAYAHTPNASRLAYLLSAVRSFARYHRVHWRTGASLDPLHAGNSTNECSYYASNLKSLPGLEFSTVNDAQVSFTEHATASHMPEVGFIAFLASGRLYCMHEMQHVAGYCSVEPGYGEASRDGARALVMRGKLDESFVGSNYTFSTGVNLTGNAQLRTGAWSLLRYAQATRITPDNDSFAAHFRTVVLPKNAQHLNARYSMQPAGGYPGEQLGLLTSAAYIYGINSARSYSWFMHEYWLMSIHAVAADYGFTDFEPFRAWMWGKYITRTNDPSNWIGIQGLARLYMFSAFAEPNAGDYDVATLPYITSWSAALTLTGNRMPDGPQSEVTATDAPEATSTIVGGVAHKPMDAGLTNANRTAIVNDWLNSFGADGHWQYKPRFVAGESPYYYVDQQWWVHGFIFESILPRLTDSGASAAHAFIAGRTKTNEATAGFRHFAYEAKP